MRRERRKSVDGPQMSTDEWLRSVLDQVDLAFVGLEPAQQHELLQRLVQSKAQWEAQIAASPGERRWRASVGAGRGGGGAAELTRREKLRRCRLALPSKMPCNMQDHIQVC